VAWSSLPLLATVACTSPQVSPDEPHHHEATDTSQVHAQPGWPVGDRDSLLDRIRDLPGADVREGGFWLLDRERCVEVIRETGTCHGANVTSPYLFFEFPEDPSPDDAFPRYRLAQDEAVLYVGPTPPESRYYSFVHYQYLRAMPDGSERLTFGSISRSLNPLNLSTARHALDPGQLRCLEGAPFDDFTVIVFTANQSTAERLREQLEPLLWDMGYGPHVINVSPMAYADEHDAAVLVESGRVPADEMFQLTMGYGRPSDAFTVVVRVAAPDDPDHPYLSPDAAGAAVFKVALHEPAGYDPFPWPELPPPDETEKREPEVLRRAQEMVARAIEEQLVPSDFETRQFAFSRSEQKSGGGCINDLYTCGGNADDARYHKVGARFRVPDHDAFGSLFVVGINHTEAVRHFPRGPRVAYNNVSLIDFDRSVGVTSVLDADLVGSVGYWFRRRDLPDAFPLSADDVDSLYVVQFARDCRRFGWERRYGAPNPYCIEFGDDLLGVCPNHRLTLTERLYLNASTATAPSRESVWAPIAVATGREITFEAQAWRLGSPPDAPPPLPEGCAR